MSLPLLSAAPVMPAGKTNALVVLPVTKGIPEGLQLPAVFQPVVDE